MSSLLLREINCNSESTYIRSSKFHHMNILYLSQAVHGKLMKSIDRLVVIMQSFIKLLQRSKYKSTAKINFSFKATIK